MQPVSATFLATLRVPHVVSVRATIEQPGAAPVVVPVVGGQLALDGTASVRRKGSATIPWTLEPGDGGGLALDVRALPFGSYLLVERGVRYADGTLELVTVGRLRIDAVSWGSSEGVAALELSDRMQQVADEPLLSPYVPAVGGSQACVELVQQVFGATIAYHVLTPAGEPVIVDAAYARDRAQAVHDLAASVAAECYFDAAGDCVVAPRARASDEPVWTIDAGETGVLVNADESLDRTEACNGVLVTGQATAGAAPFAALVTDDDPDSPTRWGGPFGRVAVVIESAAVTTQAQAQAQAAAELDARLGLTRSLTITSAPNPALEPGDVVEVAFGDGRLERHTVVSLRVPLDVAAPVELASRSLYRPGLLEAPLRMRTRTRYGAQAWAELRRARVRA